MRIKKLNIKDFKIFKGEHQITFPEKNIPVVFVGINGAGKTTVIEAIIGCLWEFIQKIQGKRTKKRENFSRSNINIWADEYAQSKLDWEHYSDSNLESGFELRRTIEPEYNLISNTAVHDLADRLKGEVGFYKKESGIPIVVFYPVERNVLSPSLKTTNIQKGNQFNAYDGAFEGSIDFNDFFSWFRSSEDLENEIRLNNDNTYTDKGLDAVRAAVLSFLEEFSKMRVSRKERTSLVLEKNGYEFEVDQLSHGEKALIAMIGDLARRLVIANPGNPNPLNGEGIILIDELDLHLHPKWQRTIISKMRKTFPNLQIICTTHSALVINHLHINSIFLLENGKCIRLEDKYKNFETYGADVEDILKIVQNAEKLIPDEIKEMLNQLFALIENDEEAKAKQIIEKLKKITDPNQPDLLRAETQLRYKELIKE